MPKRYLVTAGLPYSNGRLHVGHIAGAYLPADIYVRYLRAAGRDVLYICGSDDNGVAIELMALEQNKTPQEISTHYNACQRRDFEGLRISFDIFGGTHQPEYRELHEQFSQSFFTRAYEKGRFVKRRTKQLYDPKVGCFLPDRKVRGTCHHPDCRKPGALGDQCEHCGRMIDPLLLVDPVSVVSGGPTEVRETTHWHLRLNEYEQPLREWLESKRGSWREGMMNFALGQIKQGLPERSMTRDIAWGIPVPLDDPDAKGKVLYVWFDAPIGYVSFTAALCQQKDGDWRGYEKWWCDPQSAVVHFIGEDNTVFHTLIWPAMLMADGRHQLPSFVVANNFMNFKLGGEETKISKSRSPAESPVWVEEYLKRFDSDALRYYLTMIAPESSRTFFEPRDFVAKNNAELGSLGNFVKRSLDFAAKYFDNKVPDAGAQTSADREHIAAAGRTLEKVGGLIETHRFKAALEEVMAFARACDKYISEREPWSTRKNDLNDCAACIATCVHAVHYLAILCHPFMPGAALRILHMLAVGGDGIEWRSPPPPTTGGALGRAEILFVRLDADALE